MKTMNYNILDKDIALEVHEMLNKEFGNLFLQWKNCFSAQLRHNENLFKCRFDPEFRMEIQIFGFFL